MEDQNRLCCRSLAPFSQDDVEMLFEEEILSQRILFVKTGGETFRTKAFPDALAEVECGLAYFGKNPADPTRVLVWDVLAEKDGNLLLACRQAVTNMSFDDSQNAVGPDGRVDFTESMIYRFLNTEFKNASFTLKEQELIDKAEMPGYPTGIFLLSAEEVQRYYKDDEARKLSGLPDNENIPWWLRSSGYYPGCAAYVNSKGEVNIFGTDVKNSYPAVRPAFWAKRA